MRFKMLDEGKSITPVDNIDLFKHCSGGASQVSIGRYENIIRILLIIHGIDRFVIDGKEVEG